MTFLISFPNILRRTIGLKDLGELYDSLLGFGMTIVIEVLKWKDQWSKLIHILAMLIILFKHALSLMILLRCLYDNLFGPGVDKLLHLAMELINSSSENSTQIEGFLLGILSSISISIWWFWAILNNKWRACQRSSILRQGWLLCLTILTAGRLHLLTQFISSQGPYILLEISWILRLKNDHFVFLTIFLNYF